jgi:ubiquinone/menaquinone biosynthesis C-methylase UbiE
MALAARVLLLFAALLPALLAQKANEDYSTPEKRAAQAVSLSDPGRPERLRAQSIVESLHLRPGMSVADIGAGAGIMLPFFGKAVGASGKVYAEEIFDDFLSRARAYAQKQGLHNVEYVLGTERDPKLPESCCDVAVAVHVYHHFNYPADMLAGLRRALKPGGRFVVIDYYKRPGAMGPGNMALQHIRLDFDDVVKEIEANGFKLVESHEHIPGQQYAATFSR